MTETLRRTCRSLVALSPFAIVIAALGQSPSSQIGREVAIPMHLQDGEEFTTPKAQLIQFGGVPGFSNNSTGVPLVTAP
jgi:hypothetical protein